MLTDSVNMEHMKNAIRSDIVVVKLEANTRVFYNPTFFVHETSLDGIFSTVTANICLCTPPSILRYSNKKETSNLSTPNLKNEVE